MKYARRSVSRQREILLTSRKKYRLVHSRRYVSSYHLILSRLVRRLRKDVCLAVRTNLSGVSSDLCRRVCHGVPRFVSALCIRATTTKAFISYFDLCPTADVPQCYYSVFRFVPLDSFSSAHNTARIVKKEPAMSGPSRSLEHTIRGTARSYERRWI